MATGKTTVGKLLAERLKREFIDTDELIQARQGQSIPEIFEEQGETCFRQMEADIAEELGGRKDLVISTGGHLMLDPVNVAALSRNGRVFCLLATPQEILSRIESDNEHQRPLLEVPNPGEQIVELLKERMKGYHRFQKIITNGKKPFEVTEDLIAIFQDVPTRFSIDHPTQPSEYVVGTAILPLVRELTGINGTIVVISDTEVHELYGQSCGDVDHVITIPVGNQNKTLATVQDIYTQLVDIGFDRSGTIMSLGGSMVCDVAGFVAATYMRGVNFIQCPTSLSAIADTSIGGNFSIDIPGRKNLIGVFKQPSLVIADIAALQTLPQENFTSGMAEIIKYGFIADSSLLEKVEKGNWHYELGTLFTSHFEIQSLINHAIQVKTAALTDVDPYDSGQPNILHFGHTFAHAIEQVSENSLRHGEAVAMGMVAAANLSFLLGHCSAHVQERIEGILEKVGLPTRIPRNLDVEQMLKAMDNDNKSLGGVARFVVLSRIGESFITANVSNSIVEAALKEISR